MEEEQKREFRKIIQEEIEKVFAQYQAVPKSIKQRHLEADIIFRGLATNRPSGSSHIKAWFSTDTNILSIWDDSEWVEFARIPASPSAYTQTYSTADRTHANSTFAAVAETAATQTTPWGYGSAAQADSIPVELNDLGDDVADLKQLVNALIDDLQSIGLIG